MAEAVYEEGAGPGRQPLLRGNSAGVLIDPNKHWWAQAEAVVGFYNAYQISGEERFRD